MTKFRRKTVEIDAIQWTGKNIEEVKKFLGKSFMCWWTSSDAVGIRRANSTITAEKDDWIVRNSDGFLTVSSSLVFSMSYEPYPEPALPLGDLDAQLAEARRILTQDEVRLMEAAKRADVAYKGCDTPDWLAETIVTLKLKLRAVEDELIERDFTWLPAKDAEIEKLKIDLANANKQIEHLVSAVKMRNAINEDYRLEGNARYARFAHDIHMAREAAAAWKKRAKKYYKENKEYLDWCEKQRKQHTAILNEFDPDYTTPIWDTILDCLEAIPKQLEQFYKEIGLPNDSYTEMLDGNKPMSKELAEKLAKSLGASAQFWLNRSNNYMEYKQSKR